MAKIIYHQASRFYDAVQRVEFSPELDRESGLYVGVAYDVPEEKATVYDSRPYFDVIREPAVEAKDEPKADKPKKG